MRKKTPFNTVKALDVHLNKAGKLAAIRLGLTEREYYLIWFATHFPGYANDNAPTLSDDVFSGKEFYALMMRRPKDCLHVRTVIENAKARRQESQTSIIRSVILDPTVICKNLTDREIAREVCRRRKVNGKTTEKSFYKLIANVKKTRQALARLKPLPKFPKGKV